MPYFSVRVKLYLCAAGAAFALSGCSFHSTPVTHRTVMIVKPGIAIGHYPPLGNSSHKAQIDAFVAYFTAKGFPPAERDADYYASGRVKTFHYHATHLGSTVTADIDGLRGSESVSTLENAGSTTTQTSTTSGDSFNFKVGGL